MLPDTASLLHPMWHSSTEFPQGWPSWSLALLERVDAPGVNDTNILKKTPVTWESPTMWASWSMALLGQIDDCGEYDTNIW